MIGGRARGSGAARSALKAVLVLAAAVVLTSSAHGAAGHDDHQGECACLRGRLESLAGAASRSRALHFDEASGRDTRNYPPDPRVDYVRTEIAVRISDMNDPRMAGVCRHFVNPKASPLDSLSLRAGPSTSMRVGGVRLGAGAEGRSVRYVHEGELLRLQFDPPLEAGVEVSIEIEYDLVDPPEGLFWTPESPAWPGRAAQIHSQGQPESNHYWFPCHDSPNVRASQVVTATVPQGFVALSNGALSHHAVDGDAGTETYVWTLERGHVPYLATLVVGRFDVAEIDAPSCGTPMRVLAPPGLGGRIEATYGRTGRMVDLFAEFTGSAFPWPRYDQIIVHNFGAGGMENTSATTMHETAILDERALLDADLDGLISHELAHQWFGDLITCRSWEHIWLNEGFATYFTHLWFEHRDGEDAYLARLHAARLEIIAADRSDPAPAPFRPAMCSKEYRHPWDVFRRAANPYGKGAFILHMLREELGAEVFREGVRRYVRRFAGSTVETRDLRRCMEEASGRSLEEFFEQWCFRPGVPRVRVALEWDGPSRALIVRGEQMQPIDAANPAFALSIPVWTRGGETQPWRESRLMLRERRGEARLVLPERPESVLIDPRVSVLAELEAPAWPLLDGEAEDESSLWRARLSRGPIGARLDAVRALGAGAGAISRESAAALARVAGDASEPLGLRVAAAKALGATRGDEGARAMLERLEGGVPEARVRAPMLAALASAVADRAVDELRARAADQLVRAATSDESYACRSAGLRAIGQLRLEPALGVLIESLGTPSQDDQIRQAALEALAAFERAESLEAVLSMAPPGNLPRTRAAAFKAAARLAALDRPRVISELSAGLTDREIRTRLGAGEALAMIADPQARAALEAGLSSGSSAFRAATAAWLEDLDARAALRGEEKPHEPAGRRERPPAKKRVNPAWVAPTPLRSGP
ncbi:MAG: M1 family aminopeptidase [Phycisphaerales bacterium]